MTFAAPLIAIVGATLLTVIEKVAWPVAPFLSVTVTVTVRGGTVRVRVDSRSERAGRCGIEGRVAEPSPQSTETSQGCPRRIGERAEVEGGRAALVGALVRRRGHDGRDVVDADRNGRWPEAPS